MPSIDRTVTTTAPLDRVWAFLTDFTTTEQWDPPTVSTTRTSGDGGPGTTYKNVSKVLGHETEVDYTVQEVVPQERFVIAGEATGLRVHDTMTFTDHGDSVSVRYQAEFELEGAAKLATPAMPIALKKVGDDAEKSLQENLDRLAG